MRVVLALLLVGTGGVSGLVAAQDALEPVRGLYAAADYEAALSALVQLKASAPAGSMLEIDRYRVLCLVALGRSAEADGVIERIVTDHPTYYPSATDVPPRVRAAFTQVRRRILPSVARALYAEGKTAFERQSLAEAVQKLEKALQVLEPADTKGQPELDDLRMLVAGFLDLSRRALVESVVDSKAAPAAAASSSRPSAAAADPIPVRQALPPWTGASGGVRLKVEYRGAIEIDIDERGQVVAAEIVQPIHPSYDLLLLEAARDWKYEPARRNGQPVPIRKRVDVVLKPR